MAKTLLDANQVIKFSNLLPNLLTPGLFIDATKRKTYEITMRQGLHDFGLGVDFEKTEAWGYHSRSAPLWDNLGLNYLGPTIVAQEDVPISVRWINRLPDTHLLDADSTPHGAAESLKDGVAVQPHLHGGLTVASSDGNPFATEAFLNQEKFDYRNEQDPSTSWYHDHALGITRLNVYSGLAGFYIIRDDQDTGVADNPHTPAYDGNPLDLPANFDPYTPKNPLDDLNYEFPIAIQDKTFDSNGDLYYPAIPGDPLAGPGGEVVPVVPGEDAFGTPNEFPGSPSSPTVVAEYGGDIMIVNGVAWPKLDVEPRTYRFRLLNGSDSRFYNLDLPGELKFHVIGSDNGLLDGAAVPVDELPIGPGERYDVIVDFKGLEGQAITMTNVHPGDGPVFNDPQTTGQIMQFNVQNVAPSISDPVDPQWKQDLRPDPADEIPVWSNNNDGTWSSQFGDTTTILGEHSLAIFEGLDNYGRLFPHLGTVNEGSLLWAEDVDTGLLNPTGEAEAAPAETIIAGEYTLFEIYNTTPDAHPIHLHGTEFQILERQNISFTLLEDRTDDLEGGQYLTAKFADTNMDGEVNSLDIELLDDSTPAAAYESGFKDTAIVNPDERILVVAKFDPELLDDRNIGAAGKYVWHCHILSHEDHEMMRPLQVLAPPSNPNALFFSPGNDKPSIGDAEDIIYFDGNDGYHVFFDGSDVGLGRANIDAFDIIDGAILMSFDRSVTLDGLGRVDDSDVVKFTPDPDSVDTTAGTFTSYLDGSDLGLTNNSEDIDALTKMADGSLIFSTTGTASLRVQAEDDYLRVKDEDLVRYDPTSGDLSLYFDGSDVALRNNREDVNAASISDGELLLSTEGKFKVSGLSGQNEDIFSFAPSSIGEHTSGSFGSDLFFDGSESGFNGNVNAFDIGIG